MTHWASHGAPSQPLGWLISVARNKAIDAIRRSIRIARDRRGLVRRRARQPGEPEPLHIPDDRLRLVFTCCHPALAREAQVALTLRTLGGLTTEEIARAFLVANDDAGSRLVRAKSKIKTAPHSRTVPHADELAERLQSVLEVVCPIFTRRLRGNEGRRAGCAPRPLRRGDSPRPLPARADSLAERPQGGLLALMLRMTRAATRASTRAAMSCCSKSRIARCWDRHQIDEALALVPAALRNAADAYALQAAIAALHASARTAAETDWPQIAALYGELMRRAPSPIVALESRGRDCNDPSDRRPGSPCSSRSSESLRAITRGMPLVRICYGVRIARARRQRRIAKRSNMWDRNRSAASWSGGSRK